MTYLFVAIGLIVLAFGLYKFFGAGSKKTTENTPAQANSEEDEYLYDPKTGKRITLEQAMHGYEVEQEETPEEEETSVTSKAAAQSRTEEEVAALRIRNWMILENFGLVTEDEADALFAKIENSAIMKAYGPKMDYLFSAAPDPGLHLMVMHVTPDLGHGREGGHMGEHQLLGILKLEFFEGQAVLEPRTTQGSLLTPASSGQEFTTDKHTIYLADKENLPEALLRLEASLQGITNYSAEVHQEWLIIKSHNPATAEEADDLLQCLQAVKRALND